MIGTVRLGGVELWLADGRCVHASFSEVERRERPQVHPSARAGTSSKYTRAEVAQHR